VAQTRCSVTAVSRGTQCPDFVADCCCDKRPILIEARLASVEWNLPRWNHLELLRARIKNLAQELCTARVELAKPLKRVDRTWWTERETELQTLLASAEDEFWILNEPNPARREASRQKALLQERSRAEAWARQERAKAHFLARGRQTPELRVGPEGLPAVSPSPPSPTWEDQCEEPGPQTTAETDRRVVKRGRQELCVEVGVRRGAQVPPPKADEPTPPPLKPAVAASSRRQRRHLRDKTGKCAPAPCRLLAPVLRCRCCAPPHNLTRECGDRR
jgi:hypothetical protein